MELRLKKEITTNQQVVGEEPTQQIKTSCKDCIFGMWEELEHKQEQIGCKFARLDKFQANGGINLIKLDKDSSEICEEKDVVLEYYEISRFCNYCRNQDWKEQQKKDSNLFELVVEEGKIGFTFIIYIDKRTKLKNLEKTVGLINNQEQPCNEVILVSNQSKLGDEETIGVLNTLVAPWRRIYIHQKEAPMNFALDEAYRFVKTTFIGEFRITPSSLPTNVISNLEDIVNNKLERVLSISYKSVPGFNVFQTKLVRLLSGNTRIEFHKDGKICEGVYDKLRYFAEQQDKLEYIREYD
jgi:hypothetical protein